MESSCFRIGEDGLIEFGNILERSIGDEDLIDDSYQDLGLGDLSPGFLRVAWRGGKVEVVPEDKVKDFDQYLWRGAAVKGRKGEVGYCVSTDVKTTVQLEGRKWVITGVKKEDLIPIQYYCYGQTVLLGSWVGMVTKKEFLVTVQSSDGSRCNLPFEPGLDVSKMATGKESGDRRRCLYPGKKLALARELLQKGQWLHITKEMQQTLDTANENILATITQVNVMSLKVHWLNSVYAEESTVRDAEEKPNCIVTEEMLPKLRSLPKHFSQDIFYYYTIKETDEILSLHAWKKGLTERMCPLFVDYQPLAAVEHEIPEIEDMQTDVAADTREASNQMEESDDKYQNMSVTEPTLTSSGSKSKETSPTKKILKGNELRHGNNKSFKPGSKVLTKTIVSETTASVMWQDGTVEEGIPSISLNPILGTSYDFLPGDFVAEDKGKPAVNNYGIVQQMDRGRRTALVAWFEIDIAEPNSIPKKVREEEMGVYEMKPHKYCHFKNRPSVIKIANIGNSEPADLVGQVLNILLSGTLEVLWFSGKTSHCFPHELRLIELSLCWTKNIDGSYEPESETSVSAGDEEIGLFMEDTEVIESDSSTNALAVELPGKATGNPSDGASVDSSTPINYCGSFSPVDCAPEETAVKEICNSSDSIEPILHDEEMTDIIKKGVFSILETAPEVHKFKSNKFTPTEQSAFIKAVRKEYSLLKSSLPEGIIVKGFEDRLDLYSVMIKGPKGTPYQDGLFLFDVQLPIDYPQLPPVFRYISYSSEKFNPNLYHEGLVCVSLLGTWDGNDTEMWNPALSNLLQVLVSIQGLILVAEPYFNEPGYDKLQGKKKGQEMSQMYNELVIVRLIQASNLMISAPSLIFKDEILEHFVECAPHFVQRLEKWLEISERWNLDQSALVDQSSADFPLLPASKGFCLALKKNLNQFKETLATASKF